MANFFCLLWGKNILLLFLFVHPIAPKRQRHIVLIMTGFGTPKQSARTALRDLLKRVNTDNDGPDFFISSNFRVHTFCYFHSL